MAADDPNLSDILLDKYATHAFSILRVSAGLQDKILGMLGDLQKSLIGDIEDHGPTPKLEALLKQTTTTIDRAYDEIAAQQHKSMISLASTETEQAAKIANSAIKISLVSPIQSRQTLEAIAGKSLVNGQYPAEWWKGQAQDLQTKFAAQMRMGMLKGEGIPDLVARVRGSKENGYQDGIMQASRAQAEALVRTSVQTVANEAKIATYRENSDVIKGIQWVSTLDSRTTPICRALDGCTWDLNLQPVIGGKAWPGPVAHWNCRSTQIPITKSWKELSGKNVGATDEMINERFQQKTGEKDALAKTRASMDGQVASKLTFDDWMKTKGEEFQDQVMGQAQANLWRQGKITMSDLTDQKNRPLSLDQLKAMIAKDELIPPQTYAEGQAGLSLVARGALQAQLGILRDQKKTTTTFANETTGEMVTIQGSTPNQDDLKSVAKHDAKTVLKTAIKPDDTLSKQEVNLWGKLGVEKVHSVTPDGKVLTVKGKITPAVATEMSKAMDNKSSIHPEAAVTEVAKAGGLVTTKSKEQEIKVPINTNLEKPAFVKPTPKIAEPPVTKVTAATKDAKVDSPAANLDTRPNSDAGKREWPVLAETKVVKSLPGSTGPKLIEDQVTGARFVQKTEPSNPGHIREEFHVDNAYRALGIKTPDSKLIETDQGPVKVAKFIEGGKTLEQLEATDKKAYTAAVKKVQKNFVADALLGNYDVVGLTKDNILVADKVPYRIDNGGGLRYRAQGKLKDNFGPVVNELETMRDKNVNPASASVFGSIPETEIQRQIKDILGKSKKLLKAMPDELKPIMEARLKSLQDRLHPEIAAHDAEGQEKPAGDQGDAQAATFADFAKRVQEAGVNGVSIKVDRGQIEDLQVLVWEEKNAAGKPVTKAWLKLTEPGSQDAMAAITPALPKTSRQEAAALPLDGYFPQLMTIAQIKGTLNPDKSVTYGPYQKKAVYDLENQLKGIIDGGPSKRYAHVTEINALPEAERAPYVEMAKSYYDQVNYLAAAIEAGVKIPANVRAIKMYQSEPVEPEPGSANGLKVNEIDMNFRATTIKAGEAKELAGETAYKIANGRVYRIEAGNAEFQFIPYAPENKVNAYALQGTLTATLDGKATTEQVLSALQSIGALQVDAKPATPAYQELLYLHRGVNLMKLSNDKAYKKIMGSDRPDEEKVQVIKAWLDATHGIKLPDEPSGDYQPQGVVSTTDGFDRFYRWDLTREKVEAELPGYGLHHSTSLDIPDFIGKIIDSGGEFTSTTQRLRKGIPLGATGGMSYKSDLGTGGASYFFTRLMNEKTSSFGVRFKIGTLARQDAISYKDDEYGKTNDAKFIADNRQTTIENYKATARYGGNETIFKNGLTLDDVDFIIVRTLLERDKTVQAFKDRGIDRLPDGRKVEDVVLTEKQFNERKRK